MSDSFGRHKSTRWANASVPSYGDEWDGDEYDYDSASSEEKPKVPEVVKRPSIAAPSSDLVLSIDQLRRDDGTDLGSDSDEEPLEAPNPSVGSTTGGSDSDFDFNRPPQAANSVHKELVDEDDKPRQYIVTVGQKDSNFVPPTPTYSHHEPATPQSDRSFQSDANSIQDEPLNLNVVRGPENEIDVTGSTDVPGSHQEVEQKEEQEIPIPRSSSSSAEAQIPSAQPDPLVLSIDRMQNESDSDQSTIEERPTTSAHHVNDTYDERVEDDPLDSLISDLQSATTNDQDHLPRLDSIRDIQLPDFENTSFSNLNDDAVESPSTPTAPLDMSKSHQEYIRTQTPRKMSVRKAPRTELMSVDYSNIADAVSGYMNESRPESLRKELFLTPQVEDDSTPEVEDLREQSDSDERELQRVDSTGSLSTGKLSISSSIPNSKDESNEDISRRVSTMSTTTINMGSWKPNTNNFRDQFIRDIDNESIVNFNALENDGYRQFTKLRNSLAGSGIDSASDVHSNASSMSIPETIDAALPSIQEDEDKDSSFESSHLNVNPDNASNFESHSTFDTVLKPHEHVQNFKEQITPTSTIGTEVPRAKQKYSSLLSDTGTLNESSPQTAQSEFYETAASEDTTRAVSDDTSTINTTKKKLQTQPKYNWNDIMSKSQPIDRIALFKDALKQEINNDTGLQEWLHETLKQVENSPSMHIGKIASQAYQNAPHNELRRHTSLRSKVSSVRDKVETSSLLASSFGKKFLNRGKKLMKG